MIEDPIVEDPIVEEIRHTVKPMLPNMEITLSVLFNRSASASENLIVRCWI